MPTPIVSILAPGDVAYAKINTPLSLTCSILVDSNITESVAVTITWLKRGIQLFNDTGRVNIASAEPDSRSRYTSVLRVDPVYISDSDNYTCRAMVVPTDVLLVTASDVGEDTVLVIVEGEATNHKGG